jgi:hypothetical protein
MIAGLVFLPVLIVKSQGRNTQSDLFACIATNAPALEDILLALQDDPATVLHDPEQNHTVSSWLLLPVLTKFACLFLKGALLTEGFLLGCKLLCMMPDRFADEKEVWSSFLRSAVTWQTVGEETSALNMVWVRMDPYASGALTNWYFALIAQGTGLTPRTAYTANTHAALAYAAIAHAANAQAAPAQAAPAHAANAHAATAHEASPHDLPVPLLAPGNDSNGE